MHFLNEAIMNRFLMPLMVAEQFVSDTAVLSNIKESETFLNESDVHCSFDTSNNGSIWFNLDNI